MRMARFQHLAVFSFAATVHLLVIFSICSVNGRTYRTNDAVIIEVDDVRPSSTFANRHSGNPPRIPMMYAVNPYTGLPYHQQPNFPFWPYPLYRPTSSFSDVENVTAISADSKQQNIACGVGPVSPPQRQTPTVGIVGGSEAVPNSWPFVVGLRESLSQSVTCGGSIISPTRILTAAHCVIASSDYDISLMTVSLGMHNQRANDQQQTRRVTRVVYHKDFNKKTWQNDVAVLTVDPPINYSKDISPVCLPPAKTTADLYVGEKATFMGWGRTIAGNPKIPDTLQQATIPIVSKATCTVAYSSIITISNQHICASVDGKDTCRGDSGGPVVLQTQAGSSTWTQIAIVSVGKNCPALASQPSVYASVAFFRNWINTYMNN